MAAGLNIRIPSNVTALKWIFCAVTAVLVSFVAFTMGLLISGAHSVRQKFITELGGLDGVVSVRGVSLLYGAFNASCAFLAASCVLFGAMPASGSGLPVRHPRVSTMMAHLIHWSTSHSINHCKDYHPLAARHALIVITASETRQTELPLHGRILLWHSLIKT